MTLSNTAKQAVFAPQTDEVFTLLLTITGDSLSEPIRLCTDPKELLPIAGVRGIISNSDEYIYLPLQINLPQQDDTGIARASVTIDNIDRRLVEAVRTATSALSIEITIVLSSSPDTIEATFPDFKLEQARYNQLTVSGELSVEYFDLEPFPSGRFVPSKFSGLF